VDANRVFEELCAIREAQARHEQQLAEHMRRTEAAEERLVLVEERMRPLEAHVERWAGAGKVLAVLGAVIGVVGTLWRILA
jgi:hypothetical protein